MRPKAEAITELLNQVSHERRRRESAPELRASVEAVKRYQQRRFAHTYEDLLSTTRYGAATRFFLDDLYGPQDFSRRDAQFTRVVPALVRLFPAEIVDTTETLVHLHALSEQLDTEMGRHIGPLELTATSYIRAWREAAHPEQRELQIELTLAIGIALDRYTRRPMLRHSLKLMRGPAKAAGLGELQRFLESGFDTFKKMEGAESFLKIIGSRERELANALFYDRRVDAIAQSEYCAAATRGALRLLPPDFIE